MAPPSCSSPPCSALNPPTGYLESERVDAQLRRPCKLWRENSFLVAGVPAGEAEGRLLSPSPLVPPARAVASGAGAWRRQGRARQNATPVSGRLACVVPAAPAVPQIVICSFVPPPDL